jgi:hypothetical protein
MKFNHEIEIQLTELDETFIDKGYFQYHVLVQSTLYSQVYTYAFDNVDKAWDCYMKHIKDMAEYFAIVSRPYHGSVMLCTSKTIMKKVSLSNN